MLNKIKPKSEFTKNVLTLMTGTTIAQAIPVAISPILTRLYTPGDFGVLALFVAITSIFGSIANGRYELAIMLPKKDEDAINIFALGFIINVAITLILFIVIFIFQDFIVNLLKNKEISPWLYFIPVSVFLMGIFNLLNYFNNRMKQYKDLAKANVYKSIGGAIVQLSLGFLKAGAIGLISGQIFSQIISNTKLFFNVKRLNLFNNVNIIVIKNVAVKYKKFFLIDTWTAIIYIFYNRGIIIFLQKFFSSSIVGNYFFAEKIIGIPFYFIKSSISNVFFEKISKLSKLEIYHECKNFSFKLFKYSIIPYFLSIFLSKKYVPFIFGSQWKDLYIFISLISLSVYISFLLTPYSYILKIINRQEIGLIAHISKLIIVLIYFYLFSFLNIYEFLYGFIILDAGMMLIFTNIQIFSLMKKIEVNFLHFIFLILGIYLWFLK